MPNLSALTAARSVHGGLGSDRRGCVTRTYPEVAQRAGMAQVTLLTHINRIRQRHPRLYAEIRGVRKAQLAVRHQVALASARAHTTAWFGRRRRRARLYGVAF